MNLKYVGPKPIISHRGIEFDNNKEDKFAYLNISIQLLKALTNQELLDKKYVYHADTKRLSNDELYSELKKFCNDLDTLMETKSHDVEEEIEHNIQRANENNVLNGEDREVLKNNLDIMHDYIIQRSINKSVYYCAVDKLAEIITKKQIGHIVVPMYQTFAHVLHSIQGSLKKNRIPIDTKLDIYQENGELLAKLEIKHND